MIDRWTAEKINKVAMFIEMLKNVENFNVNEFTQKDFDKIFKGMKYSPSVISLSWLRENCVDEFGKIHYISKYQPNKVMPFATITRVEEFKLPSKISFRLADENGNILNNYREEDLKHSIMREAIERKYGKVHVVKIIEEPEVRKKYFYKINLDALNRVDKEIVL